MIRHYQVYVLYMKCTSGVINVQEVYIYFYLDYSKTTRRFIANLVKVHFLQYMKYILVNEVFLW